MAERGHYKRVARPVVYWQGKKVTLYYYQHHERSNYWFWQGYYVEDGQGKSLFFGKNLPESLQMQLALWEQDQKHLALREQHQHEQEPQIEPEEVMTERLCACGCKRMVMVLCTPDKRKTPAYFSDECRSRSSQRLYGYQHRHGRVSRKQSNKTGYTGVYLGKGGGYEAITGYDGKNHYLGTYPDAMSAAYHVNLDLLAHYGEGTPLNELPEGFVPAPPSTRGGKKQSWHRAHPRRKIPIDLLGALDG